MMPSKQQEEEIDFIKASDVFNEEQNKSLFSDLYESGKRHIKRSILRTGEAIAGLPGDVVDIVKFLAEKTGGIQPEENLTYLQKKGRNLLQSFPTSSDLRAQSAEINPQLEPVSLGEEISDEFVQDFASLATTGTGFFKSLGISLAGNLGKGILKDLELSDTTQDLSKIGLMTFAGMFGKGRGINNYIKNLYKQADNAVIAGDTARYSTKGLSSLKSELTRGASNESKRPVLGIIENIESQSVNGIIPIETAMQFDRDINREITSAIKTGDKSKKRYLQKLSSINNSALESYGETNQVWKQNWNQAKQAYAGIAQSEKIQNFIKRNIKPRDYLYAAGFLGLGEGARRYFDIPIPTEKLAGGASIAAGAYAALVSKRLATNPALRKYYQNVLNASINENKVSLLRNMKGLNRVAKKDFEENPFQIYEIEEEQ